MKQTILFILLGFMLNAALAQKYSFRLKGDIINAEDGKVALYSPADSVHALLRTDIKDGLFALAGTGILYSGRVGGKIPHHIGQ